jgi:hypothetical protein
MVLIGSGLVWVIITLGNENPATHIRRRCLELLRHGENS